MDIQQKTEFIKSGNTKQDIIEENEALTQRYFENVQKSLTKEIENFIGQADNLTKNDIELIIEISSKAAAKTIYEYGETLAAKGIRLKR